MKRTVKKGLAIFMTLMILITSIGVKNTTFAAAFGDVNGHWAETYIDTIKPLGVISGYPDGTFRPDRTITRAEFISITVNSLGSVPRNPISGEFWAMPHVELALQLNLIKSNEYGGLTQTRLNMPISREEMASIVVNAFYSTGATLNADELAAASRTLSDLSRVSSVYYDQAVAAVALNIITGYDDNTFRPTNNASRAQAAAVSHKLLVEIGVLPQVNAPVTASLYTVSGISIGDAYDKVVASLGTPIRRDLSEYGFEWLIYHNNYRNYIQVGIQNNKVVALYTASDLLVSKNGLKIGQIKSQVTSLLGKPLTGIIKGSSQYMQYDNDEIATYFKDNLYVTAYFDTADSGKMFSVKIIDGAVEAAFRSQYGTPSTALRNAFEKQLFDLTNVYRLAFGKPILKWSEPTAVVARKHSQDMAVRSFFDHTNPSGYSPFDRLLADGVNFSLAAENIAAGYTNAFSVHSGWINSPGHRVNLLRDIEFLGVGVYFGGDYYNYYTQNFITP
ncbi:MAG TPA: hypothetical protein DCS67_09640 [Clostridiales bacterium UBA8960]|jgi:uncharacterized protein YkwD|nr:hypothetical protein [Clostridiales bacterium UBA8960]